MRILKAFHGRTRMPIIKSFAELPWGCKLQDWNNQHKLGLYAQWGEYGEDDFVSIIFGPGAGGVYDGVHWLNYDDQEYGSEFKDIFGVPLEYLHFGEYEDNTNRMYKMCSNFKWRKDNLKNSFDWINIDKIEAVEIEQTVLETNEDYMATNISSVGDYNKIAKAWNNKLK